MLLTLLAIVIGALLLLAATVAAVWWRQERIVYQPPLVSPFAPSGVRRVEYVADDGQPLHGFVAEPEQQPLGLLIAFHGNADLAAWQVSWGNEVARRTGWRVLLAEYRGYGGAGGTPEYAAVRHDARAAWCFALEHLAPPASRLALFGHSLGSAVATELAAEVSVPLVALLLQSPLTSARDMARVVSTRPVQMLWKLVARVHYDSRAKLGTLETPTWIAHGDRDWLVPVSMGRELFGTVCHPGRLFVVPGAGHNDVDDVGGESYWRWVSDALTVHQEGCSTPPPGSRRRTGTSD